MANKFNLLLTEDQARIISQACEFYARIKMGQFDEIPYLCLSNDLSGEDYYQRRTEAEERLLDARKVIYPALHGAGHSYGLGKFLDADRAYDVHQVLRYTLGDQRTPTTFGEPLPICTVVRDNATR